MNHPLVAVRHGARRAPVTRRRRRSWFKAHPKEEPINHSLATLWSRRLKGVSKDAPTTCRD